MAPYDVEGSGENGSPVNNTTLGSGGTHVAGEGNLDEATKTKEALDKLKAMCVVLGINYTSKLSEFGSMRDSKRVEEYLNFLTVTRDNNFKELKQISINLKEAWQTYNTPISRIENFSWILPVLDAERAEEVKEANILSTAFVKKAENEVSKLIKERSKKLQGKYSTLKKKLEKLLKETHLMANDFEFDIKKQVNIEDYKYEKKLLKSIIRDVKSASAMRKELVLSVEMVRRGVANKNCSVDDLDVMIDRASKILYNLEFEEFYEYVSYDGQGVHDLLRTLRMQAVNYANDQSQKTRTRSGRTAYPD